MKEINVGTVLDILKVAKEKYAELSDENKVNGNIDVADSFENDVKFLRKVIAHFESKWTLNTSLEIAVSNDEYIQSNIMDILTALRFVCNSYEYQMRILESKYTTINTCIEKVKNISLAY